jgi:GT2 family glycosyltransferase
MLDLNISIVLFHTDEQEVRNVLNLINHSPLSKKVYLIDNSTNDSLKVLARIPNVVYIFNNKNLGYGSGHNIAINYGNNAAKYHLIINTDIEFDPDILMRAFDFMERNLQIGMLSPKILNSRGELQHFCRKLPNPFDLFARRFIPGFLKSLFKSSLDEYLLIDKDYSKPMNIPNLPGCFMFIRAALLKEVGGFDENFFLYVEDIDLTRRLFELSVTLYYPSIVIKHHLARGSYKFSKLVWFHIKSAIYYFNKWGWFFDNARNSINNDLGVAFLIRENVKELSKPELVEENKHVA